jgi:hypothetical protein
MEKHEKCEAKGRGASLDRAAGGLLRVPSLPYSNPGLLYKQTQPVGSYRAKRSQFASGRHGRPSPRPEALRLPPDTGDKCAKRSQSGAGGGTNKPNRRGSCRVKRSQFASGEWGRPSPRPEALTMPPVIGDKCAKRSQSGAGGCTNKPNRWGSHRAKRSQIGRWLLGGPDSPLFQYSIIPPFHRPLRLPGACRTNEPNWRGTRG